MAAPPSAGVSDNGIDPPVNSWTPLAVELKMPTCTRCGVPAYRSLLATSIAYVEEPDALAPPVDESFVHATATRNVRATASTGRRRTSICSRMRRLPSGNSDPAFEPQQRGAAVLGASVRAEAGARGDDPVTGHEQLDGATRERRSGGPGSTRPARLRRNVAVGPQLAERDRPRDL